MVVVLTVVNVTVLIVLMYVDKNTRVRASWRGKGHADRRRDSKRERHCPNEDTAASVCSFQSGQHAPGLTPFEMTISSQSF